MFRPPGKDYHIVTGFEETLKVLRNWEDFSAIIGLQGAGGDQMVNLDDDAHTLT